MYISHNLEFTLATRLSWGGINRKGLHKQKASCSSLGGGSSKSGGGGKKTNFAVSTVRECRVDLVDCN